MENIVSVSILNCDLTNLADIIKKLEETRTDMIHYDVMDGVFVNNISFGMPVLDAVNKCTDMFIDVHLMIIDPIKYIEQFYKSGADMITFHYESNSNVKETIDKIHSFGIKAGLSIKPDTPVEVIKPYLEMVDMILIMSVEPGFGGQGFIEGTLLKVSETRDILNDVNRDVIIQIDGGINANTGALAAKAGADILVSGSYVFKSENLNDAIETLKTCGR